MKPQRDAMTRYDGLVDVCIIGAGAAGSTLAKELAEGGMTVVVLEAGRWLDTQEDFLNDELAMLDVLNWDDPRESDGSNPLKLGRSNTGRAVGGSTVHFTAMKLRLHPDDFKLKTTEGIGVDWPFGYEELEPYYTRAEDFVGVSGPRDMPWPGNRDSYPQGALSPNAGDEVLSEGFDKLGIQWRMTPHAILTGEKEGRSPCMNYGFCAQGCKSDAKGSAMVTWIPAAVRAGAEIRESCFALRTEKDLRNYVSGVTYLHEGQTHFQAARVVMVCGYAIESPRLLLNSGLANGSGQVGRNLMVHPGSIGFGRFERPLDNFITPPVGIMTQDPYGTQPGRDFERGYILNRYSMFPIEFATTLVGSNPEMWGTRLHEVMDQYPHWTILTSVNEMLPNPESRVSLGDMTDDNGVPVARVTMSYSPNDKAMLADSDRLIEEVFRAAGAEEILMAHGQYHVLGTCRMGEDPETSVVDSWCRSHDEPNLFVCDGSVFPTVGAVNPSLTIEALAIRTAEHLLTVGQ